MDERLENGVAEYGREHTTYKERSMGDLERRPGVGEGEARPKLNLALSYRQLQRLAGLARFGMGLPIEVESDPWLTLMFVAVRLRKSRRTHIFEYIGFKLRHKTISLPPKTVYPSASTCILAKCQRRRGSRAGARLP